LRLRGRIRRPLFLDGDEWHLGITVGGGLYSYAYPSLNRLALDSGAELALGIELDFGGYAELATDGESVIFLPQIGSGTIYGFNTRTEELWSVVEEANDPAAPHVIGGDLYYRDHENFAEPVMVVPLDGSAPPTVFGPDTSSIALHVDETHVYWAPDDESSIRNPVGELRRAPLNEPNAVELLGPVIPEQRLHGNSMYLFFTEGNALWALPKAGGEAFVIHGGSVLLQDADESGVYVSRSPSLNAPEEETGVISRIDIEGNGVNVFYGRGGGFGAHVSDGVLYVFAPNSEIVWAVDVPD